MQIIAYHYKIYKDRFILSLSFSLLLHMFALLIFYFLPDVEKKTTLRPISLGVLQPTSSLTESALQSSQQANITQPQSHTKQQTLLKQQIDSKKSKSIAPQTSQIAPASATQNKPNVDVDLNSLNIPKNDAKFDPLATPKPSLLQSLKEQENNAKLDKLPNKIQEELYKLYGTELNQMNKEQKDYLAESYFMNYEVFQQTADRMGYPKLAAYLKQQGRGVIEFTLYPDGHIDNVKIIVSTQYEALDDSMRQVVELSAKNLKRPPQPVTVRLGGDYRIY